MASSPTTASTPGDALAARPAAGDSLDADYRQTMQDIRGSMAEQRQTAADREKAVGPVRQEQLQMLRQPLPQPPQQQQPPAVPKRNEPGADEAWLMAASVLGAIAGGLTRNHTTNALAAMTGAVEGYNEGSRQKFDQGLKQWEAENKKVLETNAAANERYRQILESRKLALEQKSMELQMVAAQYDDRAAMQLAQTKNFETLGRLIEQRMNHAQTMEMQHQRLWQQKQVADQKMELERQKLEFQKGAGQEDAAEARAKAIAAGQLPPISNPRQPLDRFIMGRVLQIKPDYDAKKDWFGPLAGERSTDVRLTNMENIAYKLASVVPDALAASDALPRGSWVSVNRAIQMVQRGTGDPRYEAFATQNMNLAELWARSQKPTGVLDVPLQQRAIEILDSAKSPDAYRTIVGQIVREIQREMEATKAQKEGKPLQVPQVPGAFTPPGQKPLGGDMPIPPPSGGGGGVTPNGIEWRVR